MTSPTRIQRKRVRGWKMPAGAVYVGRGSKWGNPVSWKPPLDRRYAVRAYENWLLGCKVQRDLHGEPPSIADIRRELAGKDLACWCPLDRPCHADVLLKLAHQPITGER